MKRKVVALLTAIAVVYGALAFPMNFQKIGNTSVSAAVTDTVPKGYTPIYTIDDLYGIRNDLSGKYILMNDIDLSETAPGGDWDSGNGWKPIGGAGEAAFSGVFDGNGYAIKNMHIYGEPNYQYIGLFGKCDYGYNAFETLISNLALTDVDIDVQLSDYEKKNIYLGSLAGYAPNITKCYVTGNITVKYVGSNECDDFIGGIAGQNFRFIKNCFNACNLILSSNCKKNSYHNIGGISGFLNNGGINCCYNVGDIKVEFCDDDQSTVYEGNIVGDGYNLLGTSEKLNTSYYDNNNSFYADYNLSIATSFADDDKFQNVVGLTRGQMKSQAAYTGFDFDTVWIIDPTSDYPYPTLRNVPYVPSAEEPTTEPSSEPTTEPTTSPSSAPLKGDINEDGVVNASDAALILIYAAKIGAGEQISIDDLY